MAAAAAPVAPNCSASHEVDAETPEIQGLAVRMKGYESRMDLRLDERLPFLVRLDGHKFSISPAVSGSPSTSACTGSWSRPPRT